MGGSILLIDDQLVDDVHGLLCNGSPIHEWRFLRIGEWGCERHVFAVVTVVDV